jgi:hypothetical protein
MYFQDALVIGSLEHMDIADNYCKHVGFDGAADELTTQELQDIKDIYWGE